MTLIKWKPIKPMINMFDDFDSIFDNIFRELPVNSTNHWNPAFSLRESNDNFILNAELPGLSKKEIDISTTDGILTISGERKDENESDSDRYHYSEVLYGSFSRSFNLPENVDPDQIGAKFNNGMLELRIPKMEVVKDIKRIAIK